MIRPDVRTSVVNHFILRLRKHIKEPQVVVTSQITEREISVVLREVEELVAIIASEIRGKM